MLPQIGAINQEFARQQIPLTQIGNQIRETRAPGIGAIQSGYLGQILSNLNLGNQLPEDVRQEAIRGALQGAAGSGFGLSNAGRGLVARDIGLTSTELGRQRRAEASRALQEIPYERPGVAITPMTALDLQQQQFDAENQQRAIEAAERSANRQAIIQSISQYAELGGSVVGSAFGSAFGTKGYGSILGKAMGGGSGGGSRISASPAMESGSIGNFNRGSSMLDF